MFSSHSKRWTRLPAMLALAAMVLGSAPHPAVADGPASTRNIILGAAAVAAGLFIYNNVHQKNLAYNSIVGYTRNGGTIYADGRIVYPNGNVLYASNGNARPCSYINTYGERCHGNAVAYYPRSANVQSYRNQNWSAPYIVDRSRFDRDDHHWNARNPGKKDWDARHDRFAQHKRDDHRKDRSDHR